MNAIIAWLKQRWVLPGLIAIAGITILIVGIHGASEQLIRIWGLMLQLFGLIAIFADLSKRSDMLKKEADAIVAWRTMTDKVVELSKTEEPTRALQLFAATTIPVLFQQIVETRLQLIHLLSHGWDFAYLGGIALIWGVVMSTLSPEIFQYVVRH